MTEATRAARHSCDLFCQVIDNFGDAGVAWRLARALAHERGWRVRLFIDQLVTLTRIVPELEPETHEQSAQGIEVLAWDRAAHVQPAALVIEAFGCALPDLYLQRLGASVGAGAAHCWINLEYLSAEDWVLGCHALPSPHPRLPLTKHFFFPGFVAGTGGVVIERGLEDRRATWQADHLTRGEWLAAMGADPRAPASMFVFCYPDAPLEDWAQALATDPAPLQLLLAPGAAGGRLATAIAKLQAPQISTVRLPCVPQEDFDQLLWSVDASIVRGEDSFVRAQLAALPFAWNIYPQAEAVHLEKLAAFSRLFTAAMRGPAGSAWSGFSAAINRAPGAPTLGAAWPLFRAQWPAIRKSADAWRLHLQSLGSLTDSLSDFAAERLK